MRTWLFRILTNRAKTRGTRDRRVVPFSALATTAEDADEPAVEPERFYPADHEDHGWWVSHPQSWQDLPERRLLAEETRAKIADAIAALPPNQRAVIALRDIEPGAELTYDYAFVGEAAEPCACGSANCRGVIVDLDPQELGKIPDHLRRLLRLAAA